MEWVAKFIFNAVYAELVVAARLWAKFRRWLQVSFCIIK